MSKLMPLRRDGTCMTCATQLPAGTTAHWYSDTKKVQCVTCHEAPPIDAPVDDVAGRSARSEYERRSSRELQRKQKAVEEDQQLRQHRVEQRPLLGRIVNALVPEVTVTPESQSTVAWKVGASGEERVAEVLAPVEGVEVLHDRLVPGFKANIDHIVVAPAGVFVIDAKKYEGAIDMVNKGSLFKADWRLTVAGRDRTKLVDGVLGQVAVVRSALGDDYADLPIHGVLCFVGANWGWVMKPKVVKGVTALWPLKLPEFVSVAGDHADAIAGVAERLRTALKPAR